VCRALLFGFRWPAGYNPIVAVPWFLAIPEAGLASLIASTLFTVAAARRFAGRGDRTTRAADTLLFALFGQSLLLGLAGAAGLLRGDVVFALSVAAYGVVRRLAPPSPTNPRPKLDGWSALLLAAAGLYAAAAWLYLFVPPLANDALTYHLPAAVRWFQSGHFERYAAWNYNPANTYSPLGGSLYLLWWLLPIGSDFFARFAQLPAVALLAAATATLVPDRRKALMLAAAVVVSRPAIGQAFVAKDDLYVAAFALAAIYALRSESLQDRLGPWRLGVAMGSLAAVKYTAVFALPLFLLAADAPYRAGWRWRRHALAATVALAIVSPWLVANVIETGRPLFPIRLAPFAPLDGPLRTAADPALASRSGIAAALIHSDAGLHWPLAAVLILWTIAALVITPRHCLRDPIGRATVLGPPLCLALFLWRSPYAEARFLLPAIAASLAGIGRSPRPRLALTFAATAAGSAFATCFTFPALRVLAAPALLATTGIAACAVALAWIRSRPRLRLRLALVGSCVGLIAIYVGWAATLRYYRERVVADRAWSLPGNYGELGEAWLFCRQAPPEFAIAASNTIYPYPLFGDDLRRRVEVVPTDARFARVADVPLPHRTLTGPQIVPAVIASMRSHADASAWASKLLAGPSRVLLIDLTLARGLGPPPELAWAEADLSHFRPVFRNSAAAVFEIVR
jgi:hypothetical protein